MSSPIAESLQSIPGFRWFDPAFASAGQPERLHWLRLREAGFRSVICNRPDGESPDQTPYALIEAEVRKAGLEFRHIPVVSGAMTQDDVDAMAEALAEMPKPVFAYCRSGTRCGVLFRAVQAQA